MSVIIGAIGVYCQQKGIEFDKPLRKGGYMQVRIGQLVFKDILNFTSPCSLSKFLKQWNAPIGKSIFPHR